MRRSALVLGLAVVAHLADTPVARACGCLSPPAVTEGDYAVNQTGEQLIFEVTPGWVTAHVLIRYQGDPSQFAWIVPVPEVPELSVSPASAFGLLDRGTAPNIGVTVNNLCPQSEWACHYENHDATFGGCGGAAEDSPGFGGAAAADAGVGGDGAGTGSPVTVLGTQTVGNYQTVTFQASQASAAVQWLQDNGFVVNSTTSIYMESYIQQNMVFVAAKLVPGAPASAITPLRMKYRAAYPSVPLILTAVAAQPHLTVTAFLFGAQFFRPMGHPVVTVPSERLAADPSGRFNYPMLLARTIDEAGSDAFTIEYSGTASINPLGNSPCCTGGYDYCHIANDGQCQCPGTDIDSADCESLTDLNDGITLVQQLGATYPYLTRITTRISPEDMTFDPAYEPDYTNMFGIGTLSVYGTQPTLSGCEASVMDQGSLAQIKALEGCDSMYCGKNALCVTTAQGAACECANDQVAQRFIDLDGKPSVTCVPLVAPVDLRAGGAQLPDACAGVDCGLGKCLDRNGIAVCACNAGAAAFLNQTTAPTCDTIVQETTSPGAESFDAALDNLAVCAPPPPSCGDAKYDHISVTNPGVDCGNATPPVSLQTSSSAGCCQQTRQAPPFVFMGGALLVLATILRRRRCAA